MPALSRRLSISQVLLGCEPTSVSLQNESSCVINGIFADHRRVRPGRANEWLAYRVSVESVVCSKSATFGSTAGSPLANPAVI